MLSTAYPPDPHQRRPVVAGRFEPADQIEVFNRQVGGMVVTSVLVEYSVISTAARAMTRRARPTTP